MRNREFEKSIKQVPYQFLEKEQMPQEYSGEILKTALLEKVNVQQYQKIIEKALIDFAKTEIENKGIENCDIKMIDCFEKKSIRARNIKGKGIILSRYALQRAGLLKMIESFYHEETHVEQTMNIKQKRMSQKEYLMLKEDIIKLADEKYYKTNYRHIYREIHARMEGYTKTLSMLKKIGITDEQIEELHVDNIKNRAEKFKKDKQQGQIKLFHGREKSVDKIFFDILKQTPGLLQIFPQLKIEFENKNGKIQRRSYPDILKEYEKCLENIKEKSELRRISNLYIGVLFNNTPVPEEKLKTEVRELSKMKTDNEIINFIRNKIINTIDPSPTPKTENER